MKSTQVILENRNILRIRNIQTFLQGLQLMFHRVRMSHPALLTRVQ